MNESFPDYFNRVVDEIHAMRKTSDERFERSCEEFDRRLAESRAEHQRWIEESNKRWEKADKQRAEHQRWMEAADRRWEESRAEHQRRMDEADKQRAEADKRWEKSCAEHQRRMDEADKQRAEADKQRAESDKRWEKSCAEHQRRMDEADKQRVESDKRWEESRAEHQRRMDEADKQRAEAAKQWAEHKRWMKQADKRWGDIANVQGEIAEDLFRRNAAATLHAHGIQVDEVHHHLKGPGTREYDVVAVNGSEAVVFEIKNKLRSDDATKFLGTQLPQFKTAFPQYEAYRVYGGIGALVMSREQEAEVAAMGLFVLTQGEDGAAHLRKPKNPRVW